jgi:hypothetical protein
MALSEQEDMLATAGNSNVLRLWRAATKEEVEATEW